MSITQFGERASWVILLALAGCSRVASPPGLQSASSHPFLTFLAPQGPIAAAQRVHFFEVVGLVLIAVLPVLLLTPVILWRYRLGGTARYTPKWAYSGILETLMWGGPIAIVTALAVLLWQNTVALDPFKPIASASAPPLQVEVIGYDWKWLFIYPQLDIASIGELAFPIHRELSFKLTSDTVMQSFLIPALGGQIYAMPGMVTQLHLLANHVGTARGLNAQFNGSGFYQQKFMAEAMKPDDFARWVRHVKATGMPFTSNVREVIGRRSTLAQTRKTLDAQQTGDAPLLFTDVSTDMFQSIVRSFMTH